MAPSRRPSAPPLVFLVEGEKGGVRSFRMPPVMPSPDLRRGGHPGEAFGDCPRTSTWRTRSESFACEAESFACELENFACERFSFRTRSAKPLKSFCFSRPRNFRIRGFQCYQRLAADFVSRFFSMTFSRRWAELGHCFSLPNNSRYHRSAFWKTKFRRRLRIVSGPAREARTGSPRGVTARRERRRANSSLRNAVIHLIELVG